jgi:hypothetical protein
VSLSDPTGPELVEVLAAGGWPVSAEPLPDLSMSDRQELELALLKIGATIARSPERMDGWEEAYSAFAEAFQNTGQGCPVAKRNLICPTCYSISP